MPRSESEAAALVDAYLARADTHSRIEQLESPPAIARIERGAHEPRLATLRPVAHALDAELVLDFVFHTHKGRQHLATL